MTRAIYQGRNFEVIRSNETETLLSSSGNDRMFARTSEVTFLDNAVAASANPDKDVETVPAKTASSKTKTLVETAEKKGES
jgi:hypothetical protein